MNNLVDNKSTAEKFFWKITNFPKTILAASILLLIFFGFFLPKLTADTTAEAFMPDDHPAVVYRDKAKEIFGLSDPMVVAIVNKGKDGVFNPKTLRLVSDLTEEISDIPGIDPDRITSLSTENNIFGTEDGMVVEPFFVEVPETDLDAKNVLNAVMDFPLYVGSLVAKDGTTTLIIAELLDENGGDEVYKSLVDLSKSIKVENNEKIHVAGEGALSGYLGTYIDTDARRLNPIAGLVITLVLLLAYRTFFGTIIPNLVVLSAVVIGIGSMAAFQIPYYVITNALPVILIAIGVADGIHILGQYYEEKAKDPEASVRVITVRSMVEMWRPVTITSVSDIAGFLAISFASFMPPMRAFGIFASVGVIAALIFSLFTIPAALVLFKPKISPVFTGKKSTDRFGLVMDSLGNYVTRMPYVFIMVTIIVAAIGFYGALNLEVNEERTRNFKSTELIVKADKIINEKMDGTSYLDVVIETPNTEDLFKPSNLKKIEKLQEYMESFPKLQGTVSVVDYLKQMNRSMNENKIEEYKLPNDSDLIAQYFLIYSASANPTDFEEEIDYDYRLANVRGTFNSGSYKDFRGSVEKIREYIKNEFNTQDITANLSGRVNVDYFWIGGIKESHFKGLFLALLAVWIMAALSFRSIVAGLLSIVPVTFAVLFIYAVMGFLGIWLGVGTSMFAAIAVGTGVDFAVHTIDRIVSLVKKQKKSLEEAYRILYRSTGRALLFNFFAILLGFGVLTTSQVPPLIRFGALVGVAVLVSFLSSVTLLPAIIKVTKPKFLGLNK